jgi:adenylate cyclase
MDTCFSVLLKHDLTIDKFQGDGILAFSNNPIPHSDYIERACLAALEIKNALAKDREFYFLNWQKELQIRAGISAGYANVGFYGNKKYFKTYTAIGIPLSLAARLTSFAQPDQLIVDAEIAEICKQSNFSLREIGQVTSLKGFEGEKITLSSLEAHPAIL